VTGKAHKPASFRFAAPQDYSPRNDLNIAPFVTIDEVANRSSEFEHGNGSSSDFATGFERQKWGRQQIGGFDFSGHT
jgi:hypothetical protein